MIRLLGIFSFLTLTLSCFGQNELKKNWYKGNIFYENSEYEDALYYYQKAVDNSPLNFKSNYNLGNAHFRVKDYEKAVEQFEKIVDIAPERIDQSWTYHNLGNACFLNQKLDDAIGAYKEALKLNPADEATRYNLAYAQLLKKEQEQQNQNQSGQNNENQDQNEGDQNENQNGDQGDNQQNNGDKGDQNQNNDNQNDGQDNGDQNDGQDGNQNDDQEGNNGQNDEKDDEKDGEGEPQGGNSKHQPISKEQARRILEAAARKEKKVQEELDKGKVIGTESGKNGGGKIDW